jgi:hypothetical protein
MNTRHNGATDGTFLPAPLSASARTVFAQLFEAHELARASGRKTSDFAAEITSLTDLGITASVLRWLICRGYAKCLREVTRPGDRQRRFEPVDNLVLDSQSCFVLTRKGILLARALVELRATDVADVAPEEEDPGDQEPSGSGPSPHWDARRRELRLAKRLVKRFRVPAPNQEAVLAAFQEEGWPNCVDDPLPPKGDISPKRRLHDTIKALNRKHCQKPALIRFLGNGTGRNIVWELKIVTRDPPRRQRKGRSNP